jgi:hypothetical protein
MLFIDGLNWFRGLFVAEAAIINVEIGYSYYTQDERAMGCAFYLSIYTFCWLLAWCAGSGFK